MENVLQKQLLKVAETIEQKLDQEIQRLDELDLDSIENIREHRLQQMKKMIKQKEEWMAKVKIILYVSYLYSLDCKNSLMCNRYVYYIHFIILFYIYSKY